MVKTARGDAPFDLLVKNVRLLNVFTREIYKTNIGIYNNVISYVGGLDNFKARDTFDARVCTRFLV